MKDIQLDKIYEEIEKNKKDRGYGDEETRFEVLSPIQEDYYENLVENHLDIMFREGYLDININNHKDSSFKRFLKKVARKVLLKVGGPFIAKQNAYNDANLMVVTEMYNTNKKTENNRISQYLDNQEKMIQELETKVLVLEKEIEELKKDKS